MSRKSEPTALASARLSAALFAALGDGTRLQLIQRLSLGDPCSISELSTDAHVTRQAITKHLRVLETAGLIEGARLGREMRFTFTPVRIDAARDYLDQVSKQWDDALNRLKAFVETAPEKPSRTKRKP
jgi:DNA-binding transcriptional ArsR family regulator